MARLVAFIPARGGSKSIPGKNVRDFAGKPLIHWTVSAALGCELVDQVYVSTDSVEVVQCLAPLACDRLKVIGRSEASATDTASTESALLEFAAQHSFLHVFLIQATSPLLQSTDLTQGYRRFLDVGADSMLSVCRQKRFIWERQGSFAKPVNYDPQLRPRRQQMQGHLVENGAFYLTSRQDLLDSQCRLSGNMATYEMAPDSYIEIDDPDDWTMCEALVQHRAQRPTLNLNARLRRIRLVAVDVDGVLTDSGMYYGSTGEELKKFNTRDGKGFELLRSRGVATAIVTAEDTAIVQLRGQKVKADYVFQGVQDKLAVVRELCATLEMDLAEVAYIGDDLNDTALLQHVGLSACPSDAVKANLRVVDYVCRARGGGGCVREVCDLIVDSRP